MRYGTKIRWLLPAWTLAAAAGAGGASAQTLRGRVVDTATEAPVAGATLRLLAADSQAVASGLSADAGDFSLTAPAAGEFLLRIDRLGYQTAVLGPLRLRAGGFLEVTVALGPEAIPVDPFEVEVRGRVRALELAGFYERRQRTAGQFLERAEIDARRVDLASDLLSTFRGIRIWRGDGAADVQLRGAPARAMLGSSSPCLPPIYVNGVLSAHQSPPAPSGSGARLNLDAIRAEEIEAIEVYVGSSTVPAAFARDGAACGAIVIWLRR